MLTFLILNGSVIIGRDCRFGWNIAEISVVTSFHSSGWHCRPQTLLGFDASSRKEVIPLLHGCCIQNVPSWYQIVSRSRVIAPLLTNLSVSRRQIVIRKDLLGSTSYALTPRPVFYRDAPHLSSREQIGDHFEAMIEQLIRDCRVITSLWIFVIHPSSLGRPS